MHSCFYFLITKFKKKNVDKIKDFMELYYIVLCAQTILLSYFMEKLLIRQEKKNVLFFVKDYIVTHKYFFCFCFKFFINNNIFIQHRRGSDVKVNIYNVQWQK